MTFVAIFAAFLVLIAVLAGRHARRSWQAGKVQFRYSAIPMTFTKERDLPLFIGFIALDIIAALIAVSCAAISLWMEFSFG